MAGLTAAFALLRLGVSKIVIVDDKPRGKRGAPGSLFTLG